jgi:F-type H+-transporting ATPase subunit b
MTEASGIAALGIDGKTFLAQLANFLIIYILLSRFAFKPLVKVLEERRKKVIHSIKTAKKIEEEKAELDLRITRAIAKAKNEAQTMIAQTEAMLKEERATSQAETEARAAQMITETKGQIERYKADTKQELTREIGMLVVKATERIVHDDLPEATKNKVKEKVIAGIKS